MKKFAAILLITVYTLATMGFSIKEVCSCGKFKKTAIAIVYEKEKDKCKKGDKDNCNMGGKDKCQSGGKDKCQDGNCNSDGCCNKKFHYFKVKDSHISVENVQLESTYFTILYTLNTSFQNSIFSSQKTISAYKSKPPPFYRVVRVYITNCVFRI